MLCQLLHNDLITTTGANPGHQVICGFHHLGLLTVGNPIHHRLHGVPPSRKRQLHEICEAEGQLFAYGSLERLVVISFSLKPPWQEHRLQSWAR